ncbi:MAG: extracellular solute-binding protein [Chloroflexota bacterium]
MSELNFSIYGNQPSILETSFLDQFRALHRVRVNVDRMNWSDAWPNLLNYAIHGGGPHISQIGAIWTSSLVAMNVLRPITPREIVDLGGEDVFYPCAWQNALAASGPGYWAVPFTTFAYVILYRRDLLQKAGVDEQQAFVSAEAMCQTLERLKAAGIDSPLILPSGNPYRARVHCAASWVWGAGGEFVKDKEVLFDRPEALRGLKAFFDLYRYLSPADHGVSYAECGRRVTRGQAAVTITGIHLWTSDPQELEQLGTAPVPGIPWVGGSNLVIWNETKADMGLNRTAFQLIMHLTSRAAQAQYAQAHSGHAPARADALQDVPYAIPSLIQTVDTSVRTGRAYRPALIWVRMLNDLSRSFDRVTMEILSHPEQDLTDVLTRPIEHLAGRFRLMLAGT